MTAAALWERGRRRFPWVKYPRQLRTIRGPLPRHERWPLQLPAALLAAQDAADLGIGLALQRRRADAYSDRPSIGWSAAPRFGKRAFSFSPEFAVQAPPRGVGTPRRLSSRAVARALNPARSFSTRSGRTD